jgi:hypothetical protein
MAPPPFPSQDAPSGQVCKYFLAGHCKFGKNCRFLHIRNSPAPLQSHTTPLPQKPPPGQPVSIEELIRFDLGQAKNVWPFSCYGITNNWSEGGNIIGGEFSPEELRVEAYHQMKVHQNIQNYITQVTQMKAMFENKKVALIENPKLAQQPMHSHQQKPPITQSTPHTASPFGNPNEPHTPPPPFGQQQHQSQHILHTQSNIPPASSTLNQNFEFGKIPEDLPPNRRI